MNVWINERNTESWSKQNEWMNENKRMNEIKSNI